MVCLVLTPIYAQHKNQKRSSPKPILAPLARPNKSGRTHNQLVSINPPLAKLAGVMRFFVVWYGTR
jgi:hypothetical protein